ncbi:MAG: RHS repeat protein, partial [Colwellia sp.]|nr:RHS repeat protein [Colwellia sp.]
MTSIIHKFEKLSVKVLLLTFCVFSSIILAAPAPDDGIQFKKPSEFELERMAPRTDIEPLSSNLAGENISLADGGITFSVTDISIPLNMAVNANVTRVYQRLSGLNDREAGHFSDWQIDLPKIHTTVVKGDHRWTPNYDAKTACSQALAPGPITGALGQVIEQHEYWNGATLHIPNHAGGKLLTAGGGVNYKTLDNTQIKCHKDSQGNDFFIVTTTDGTKYSLAQRRLVSGELLIRKFKAAPRERLEYLVTNIKDRFGNELDYEYEDSKLINIKHTEIGKPEEILVTFNYENSLIAKIVALGKEWQYVYEGTTLRKVIRPDLRFWQYTFPSFTNYAPQIGTDPQNTDPEYSCAYRLEIENSIKKPLSITHPMGAIATFTYELKVHGRTEVPAHKMFKKAQNSEDPLYNINACYGTIGIKHKSLKLLSGENYKWKYKYTNNGQHWNNDKLTKKRWPWIERNRGYYLAFNRDAISGDEKNAACTVDTECSVIPLDLGYEPYDLRVLTLIEPDGNYKKHYISKRWDHTDGKVVATQWFDKNDTLLKTQSNTFKQGDKKGSSGMVDPIPATNMTPITSQTLAEKTIITENTNTYTTEYTKYNTYGAPGKLIESNSFTNETKYTYKKYHHDTPNWLLNLPTKTFISSSDLTDSDLTSETPVKEITYKNFTLGTDSTSLSILMPEYVKLFNVWQKKYVSYHNNGKIKKNEYNQKLSAGNTSVNRYQIFENYKRGIPQTVKLPNRLLTGEMRLKRVVNDNGWVTSSTDLNGTPTGYGYDKLGRLTAIDLSDDTNFGENYGNWLDTFITWDGNIRTLERCTLNAARDACTDTAQFTTTETYD